MSTNILVGNGVGGAGQGFLYQTGGSFAQGSYDQLQLGAANGTSYGYYNMSGGTASFSEVDIGGFTGTSTGVMDMRGGTMTVGVSSTNGWLIANRTTGSGGVGILNITGGTITFTGPAAQFKNNWGSNGTAIINVANAVLSATNANIDLNESNNSTNFGEINLLSGGTLQTHSIAPNATGTKLVNFNGGTLKASTATTTFITTNNTAANVYSGGGTIDNNGVNITVPVALLAASGSGVSSVAITNAGSGYFGAPAVTFSGGGGTGAAGYAVVSSGTISSIVITNPGTGYTGTPTITLTGGGGSGATLGAPVLTANTSGGMTFAGIGTTTLTATNTYNGTTTLSGGTLSVMGSIASAVSLTGSATLAGTGTASGPVTVASGGVIAPGNGGAGTLAIGGTLTLNGGSVLNLELSGTAASDKLALTSGGFSASGTTMVNLTALSGFGAGIYPLITGATGITAANFAVGTAPAGYGYVLSANSGTLYVTAIAPAAAPTGLGATSGTGQIFLSWTASGGADSYNVKRSITSGSGYTTVAPGVTATSYTDTGLTNGTTYYYVVSAVNVAGESANSTQAAIAPVPPAPVISSAASATGTSGVAFSYAITASNNPASYAATGLPNGLIVNTGSGLISGTPTSTGTTTATINAINAGGTGSSTLTITVAPQAPVIGSSPSTTGTINTAFSYQITATNNPTSYGAGGLPSGLSVDNSTGIISGTPTATGTTGATISAIGAGGTGSASLTIVIVPQPPVITSGLSMTGTAGNAFSYQITATNNPTSYGAGGLPSGLNVDTSTGLISGTPAVVGTSSVTISAGNAGGTGSAILALNFTDGQPVWTGSGSDANWQTAANWTILPAAGGILSFAGTTQLANNNNFTANTQFAGIKFNSGAGAFNLGGNGIMLSGSIVNSSANTQTINLGIVINGGSQAVTASGGSIVIGGLISGTGGINANGGGLLSLATVSGSNTYSGGTVISSGTLEFQGRTSTSGSSALTINSNTTLSLRADTSGTFTPASFGGISGAAANSYSFAVNGLTGSGTGKTLTIIAPSQSSGGSNVAINVSSTSTDTLNFSSTFQITSNSGSAFSGPSDNFNLSGANLILNGLSNSSTNGDGGITISSTTGNSLTINGNVSNNAARTIFATVNSGVLTLNNGVSNSGGANNGFFVTLSGGTLNINNNGAINTNSAISGSRAGLAITGGTLDNTSGSARTLTANPTILLNGDFAFSTSGGTTANDLNLGTAAAALGPNAGTARTITTNGSATLTIGGSIANGTTANSITKAGTGTLVLSGSSSYTGTTAISGGELNLNGNLAGSGLVTVSGSATLTGTGTISGPANVSGAIAPGNGVNSSGTLTLSGSLTFNHGAVLNIGLSGTGNSDKIISGSVSATGTTTMNLTALAGFAGTGSYPIISGAGNVSAANFAVGTVPAGFGCSLSATGGILYANVAVPPVVNSATSATGTNGSVFSYQITGSNSPTSYAASGLPAGLSVNTGTGLISGTPTATGSSNVTISAINAGGTGSMTLVLTVLPAPPTAPSSLVATGGNASVTLSWSASSGAGSYNVKRSLTSGSGYTTLVNTGAAGYTDTSVGNGTTYYYMVSALNAGGEGANSPEVAARPTAPVTAQERRSSAIAISGTTATLTVRSSVIGHTYQVQYSDNLTSGTWQNYGAAQPGTSGDLQLTAPVDLSLSRRFYRILIQP